MARDYTVTAQLFAFEIASIIREAAFDEDRHIDRTTLFNLACDFSAALGIRKKQPFFKDCGLLHEWRELVGEDCR